MSEHLWMKQAACLGVVHEMWDENTPGGACAILEGER
jgi:hypothetical protein